MESHEPKELATLLDLGLSEDGAGRAGFEEDVKKILQYSVNVFDQGFMDKLYTSPEAVRYIL